MSELIKEITEAGRAAMDRTVVYLDTELQKIRAGKASPAMVDSLRVDYYGSQTPISQVATVSAPEARTLTIQPFEKNMIGPIERVITEANLGFNPQNDGVLIRINIPMLTEERRKQLVKQCREISEEAKVAIRSTRRETLESLKKLVKEGVSEDMVKTGEADVQKLTDAHIVKIDQHLSAKEEEIMKV
jgi:ribosome recycling factor